MDLRCHSCANDIVVETDNVICQGFCRSTFHIKCSQISAELWTEVKSNSMVYWMCPSCRKLMSNTRFREALGSTNDLLQAVIGQQNQLLEDLRSEIKKNAENITKIMGKSSIIPLTPRPPWTKVESRGTKRPRKYRQTSTPSALWQ